MRALLFVIATLLFATFAWAEQDYQVWEDTYSKYVYIEGLEEDLFQKYYIKESRGPKWGKDEEYIAKLVDEDFYERSTYWAESGYPEDECPHFSEDDFDSSEAQYEVSWEAVKKVSGSDKTVFYFGVYNINIYGNFKTCNIKYDTRYVFLNKIVDGKPVFLGIREFSPRK